jgi:hypothetical protein
MKCRSTSNGWVWCLPGTTRLLGVAAPEDILRLSVSYEAMEADLHPG